MTKVLKLKQNIKEIVEIITKEIKDGKVIICPTDTVYGFLCDATNKKAVEKIFKIKKRLFKKPIPIFVKDIKMAKKLAVINKEQGKLLKKYWPGKITVVLKNKNKKQIYGVDKKTIALRIPNHSLINNLFKKINFPLAQTSVNISGKSPIANTNEAFKLFDKRKNKPDLIIDAGKLKNKSSKIIDLITNPPKILRK